MDGEDTAMWQLVWLLPNGKRETAILSFEKMEELKLKLKAKGLEVIEWGRL